LQQISSRKNWIELALVSNEKNQKLYVAKNKLTPQSWHRKNFRENG